MKKITIAIVALMFLASCGRNQPNNELVGKYSGKMQMVNAVDTNDMNSVMTAAYIDMFDFDFDFKSDQTFTSVINVQGNPSDTIFMEWKIVGDSVFFYENGQSVQAYRVTKTPEGYDLSEQETVLKLTGK